MQSTFKSFRLSASELKILEKISTSYGMNISTYIKMKLFDHNSDITSSEYLYNCPSGERYNYILAGLSMLNYLSLKELINNTFGDEEGIKINDLNIVETEKKLEKLYGFTKKKAKQNE